MRSAREKIADHLQRTLESRNWTPADLAKRCRMRTEIVQAYCLGEREINLRELADITNALGVPILRFLVRPNAGIWKKKKTESMSSSRLFCLQKGLKRNNKHFGN